MAVPAINNYKPQLKGDTFRGGEYKIIPTQDLTGATGRCQFRRGGKKNQVQVELTVGNGLTITDASNGVYQIDEITPLDWAVGNYNYDIDRLAMVGTPNSGSVNAYYVWEGGDFKKVDDLRQANELREEVIDYLELALYAAAEHVDDVALIAKGFYPDKKKYKSSNPAKQLDNTVKKHKSLISASINAIKHHQARIRLYSLEIQHGEVQHCLHGYFIEGVHDGEVGPNNIFHDNQRQVFSITSLMWEILCFVLKGTGCFN